MNLFKKRFFNIAIVILALIATVVLSLSIFAVIDSSDDTPSLEICANNISFSDNLYLKYAVDANKVSDPDAVKLLIWTGADNDYLKGTEDAIVFSNGMSKVNGKECLIFDYSGISAKQMTDVIYARAYIEQDGKVYYSNVKKYSVLQYVYNKLGYTGTATQNESLTSLLQGLIEYGASAQKYFNYKTDTLATDKFVKVSLSNAVFSDGFDFALIKEGSSITAYSISDSDLGVFMYWCDEYGNYITDDKEITINVGSDNITYYAVYDTYSGGEIDGAGAILNADGIASNHREYDPDNAILVNSSEILDLIKTNADSSVYMVSDGSPIYLSESFNGNNSVIIAPAGVIVNNSNVYLNNVTIIGQLTVQNSNNVTLEGVGIVNDDNSLITDKNSEGIKLTDCYIISKQIAASLFSDNATILNSFISGKNGIVSNADEFTIYNSYLFSGENAIIIRGSDCAINNCTISSGTEHSSIHVSEDSLNTLISFNVMNNSKDSITVSESTNTVILFNSVYNINAQGSTNTYIVENSLGGTLKLSNNNFLLCDENFYKENKVDHSPILSDNENVNGNNLMDVNARNEVGAKEELLPHTNKDLFLDMERKTTVKDVVGGTSLDLNTFVENNAKTNDIVIVPPGAYFTAAGDPMSLGTAMSNTEIYAFGVYNEHRFNKDFEYRIGAGANNILSIAKATNITIHGISLAYDYQSSGQVHVLAKLGNNQILVVPAAGYDLDAGFGRSNTDVFSNSYTSKYGAGTPYSALGGTGYEFVSRNDDGTLILKMTTAASYDAMNVGDIMTCRMAGDNQHTVSISGSKDIKLMDMVLYGYSAALMTVVSGETTGASLERVHNTARAPFVIDKATYDMYSAWENEYNVDLEIYVDEFGRYRGSLPRVGSVDATHVSASSEGLDITSCLFENMCDDGSNQRGGSSRLAGVKDNGDGTTTLYIKGMVTSTYHGIYKQSDKKTRDLNPIFFSAGEKVYVYTSKGELLCDTVALTSSKNEDDLTTVYEFDTIRYIIYFNSIKVATDAVNFSALEGYELSDNHYNMEHKVLVDNISHVSEGFVIDNLLVRNSTARGVLIKTINATVKNSTFRNVTSTGNLLSVETSWGESTVARNVVISGCLFDNTGFSHDDPIKAPIAISGLSTYGSATVDTLRANNIRIEGCEFKDYGHNFGIYVNGVQNVRIINNIFDPEDAADPGQFIKILTALNIEISGNQYRSKDGNLSTIKNLDAEDYTHIFGSDVGDTYKAKCDIYVGDNHLSSMRVFYADASDRQLAENMAKYLEDICGYSVSYSDFYSQNSIKLIALNRDSDLISSNSYTIASDGNNLTITAATPSSLAYAVEDFIQYIEGRNKNEQTISFEKGFSLTRTFSVKSLSASNSTLLKYSGIWSSSGNSMISMTDADYIEFDFNGTAFTLLFSEKSTFDLYIDDVKIGRYTVNQEKTFSVESADHRVKLICTDTASKVNFAGVRYSIGEVTRTTDKEHYIQFIGDSVIDKSNSFAHIIGNNLEWDYSVVIGDTLPYGANSDRKPDIVFIFLGTDSIDSDTTQAEVQAFANKYRSLVADVISRYGANTQIHLMQALSTSESDAMFDTNHIRYQAIELAMTYAKQLSNNVYVISSQTVKDWNIEFDTSKSTTYPTEKGYEDLTCKIMPYVAQKAGYTDYYNHSFDLSAMKNYNGKMQAGLLEGGISFNRYNFIDKNGNPINGHVFISGNDYANKIVTDSGRYLIFKFRSTADYGISFNLRTNDYGTNLAESGRGYVYTVSRTASLIQKDCWEVAVIDLAQFLRYTTGTNIGVQVRITTTMSEIDIADVTIVDSISDANLYILTKLGDTEYMFYERWDEAGVCKSVTGKEVIKETVQEIDLSYVNHRFNLLLMKMYNGSSITSPTEIMIKDDDGIEYNHFEYSKTGHIFFKGSNTLTSIQGDTGNYLVLKYRASKDSYLRLEMQTSDLPFNSTYPYQTMKNFTKQTQNIPDGWEIAVIDLSQFTSYQRDSELDVLIRITTACSYVDIAYAALVDDISEAEMFVEHMGDNSYVHYTNWAGTGTTKLIK